MLFGFWRPYILFHFYWKCFLLFLFPLFFLWMGWIFFVDCRNTGVSYIISCNHTIIYSLKFVHQWRSVCCIYELFMHYFSTSYYYNYVKWLPFSSRSSTISDWSVEFESLIITYKLEMYMYTEWCENNQSCRTLSDKSSEFTVNWNWLYTRLW